MSRLIAVMDTETTGFDPADSGVVEVAVVYRDTNQLDPEKLDFEHSLVNPGHPIGVEAMATHHITEDMVKDAPDLQIALTRVLPALPDVTVWHNAAFDLGFMPEDIRELPHICTWRCSMQLWPTAPSHKNGALWYWLGLNHSMPPEAGGMPHRALFDSIMTADLLGTMVQEVLARNPSVGDPIDHLIWLTQQPVILDTVRFGKHKGMKWAEVPVDYMQWCLRQRDMDADVHATCRFYMDGGR